MRDRKRPEIYGVTFFHHFRTCGDTRVGCLKELKRLSSSQTDAGWSVKFRAGMTDAGKKERERSRDMYKVQSMKT